jgi:NAD(P)-dependent dehydrogenase (short-subunit alcohol dehydrogenase family)
VSTYRFEGRVAVVTGAGRGIGRAYARLLAERGARVVVNDLGGSMQGGGADAEVASRVAAEIAGSGGAAIADGSDVASPEGGDALIGAALERFGRVDVLINNAGIIRWAGLPEIDADNLLDHLAVHVGGSFNTTRAAWPHMVEQGYGRIVMTTSAGMFGLPNNLAYATAKAAVIGLTRSISVAGAPHGIKANLIAPAAMTRMAGQPTDEASALPDEVRSAADAAGPPADGAGPPAGGPGTAQMSPDLVAPMAAFLAHEACPVSGEVYAAGAGRFARMFIASTAGYVRSGAELTIEDVAEHWGTINDETGYYVPTDLSDWSSVFMAHLRPSRPASE